MLKPIIAATAVLAIGGSSIVYAQERFGDHRGFAGGPRAEYHHRLTADDIAAFTDARIAALRAGLELSTDQAKNWPPFEQALRDLAQLRIQRMQAWEAADQQAETSQQGEVPSNPFDRLARRADNLAKTSAALKRLADTGTPLYQSLSDAQKHRFRFLAHMLRPHHWGPGAYGGGWGGWGEKRGYGRDGGGLGRDGEHEGGWFGHEGRRFEEDGRGPRGPYGGMHHFMDDDEDQGSQL
jgi:LTXXQ motif family protein